MTLAVESPITSYITDGVSASFPLGFTVSEPDDVQAQLTDALGNVTAPAFSVSGGNAVFSVVPAGAGLLQLLRKTPIDQLADFSTGDSFASGVADSAFDRTVRIVQEVQQEVLGTVRAPYGEALAPLPPTSSRVGGNFVLGPDPTTGQIVLRSAAVFKGDPGSSGLAVGLFAALPGLNIPLGTDVIQTSGYSVKGLGAALYVEDDTVDDAYVAAHPRCSVRTANGRYFRLDTQYGFASISQFGALGDENDDQAAVQAATDYCIAVKCRLLEFDFDVVSVNQTLRTSNADQYNTDAWAQDGQAIWVTGPIKFMGRPTGTHLKIRGITGGPLETDWQNVGGNVWRGSGINLLGGASSGDHTSYGNTAFVMENIWLDGTSNFTGDRTPVTTASPDGPDLTQKGIRQQDTSVDNITLINCKISGFKGESFYVGGGNFVLKNVTIEGSNQSCFNPSTGVIHADNCDFGNAISAFEVLGGIGGRLTNCRFYNCVQISVTGGPAGGPGTQWNYATPNRDPTKAPPWIDFVDCEFTNCGTFIGGNYVRLIRFRATDTLFSLATALSMGECTSTYIDGDYTIDQMGAVPIFNVQGAPNLTTPIPTGLPSPANILPISDLHIRVNVHRTAHAKTNNLTAIVFTVTGEIDQYSCSFAVGETDGVSLIHAPNYGGTTIQIPLMTCDGPTVSQTIGSGVPYGMHVQAMASGPYAIPFTSPRVGLQKSGSATAVACTMATTIAAAHGQRCRIYWMFSTTGASFTFARNGAGLRLNSDCVLGVNLDWLEVEYNAVTSRWHETRRSVYAP